MAAEKRLIDANALEEVIRHDFYRVNITIADKVMDFIRSAPTVEATEVVCGRWVLESEMSGQWGGYTHKCGVCEDYYTTEANTLFFCPRCGAKMNEIEHPNKYGFKFDLVDGKWERVWGLVRERYVERRDNAKADRC